MTPSFPLYDGAALRAVEARALAAGGDAFALMLRAGGEAWRCVLAHWPQARRIVVACGPGNNGGDGYVLARHAHEAGREVRVLRLPRHAPSREPALRAEREFRDAGGRLEAFAGALPPADLVVDALFGIGLSRAPDAATTGFIAAIDAADAPVLALDVPSGVDADTGAVPGTAVHAARTLQFIAAHVGLATGPALDHVGTPEQAALDAGELLAPQSPVAERVDARALAANLRPRRRNAHKGDSGRVLCVGGDHGKGGAVLLCAEAALRSGAGLVDVATRSAHVAPLLARRPEAMAHVVDDAGGLHALADAAGIVAIGPGLGQDAWGRALLQAALECDRPLVLDADALNLLAAAPAALRADSILTPHPGEAARLLGCSAAQVQADRRAAARALCERHGCTVLLKGAGTIVAAPGRLPRIIDAGNPGMAVGGMGDVLTGVVAALRAQGLEPFDAACQGALLHGAAGDAAAAGGGERGLLASDLFPQLRRLASP